MTEEIIKAKSITKSFGYVQVLKGLDLTVNKGDRYVLFGSNGVGKTTLVKILATLVQADSGEISIFNMRPKDNVKKIKSKIGFMSHDPLLYNDLSAHENLDFFADLYSIPDRTARVEEMLKMVGMSHRSFDRVGTFSRGMRQRLSMARALIHDPDVLFLDEPYSGLDIRAQGILNDLIVKLNGEGKSFFTITHDIEKGFEIASRSGVLSEGRIAYEVKGGSVDDFSKKYKEILKGEVVGRG
jgi:heme exporter protein A